MKANTKPEPTLEHYDTTKFRKEVRLNVSMLAAKEWAPNEAATFDRAADLVARRYQTNRGGLSWIAHRTDFMKERFKDVVQLLLETMEEPPQRALPGLELNVQIPRQLIIDDEIVERGDPRMTLQAMIEKTELAEAMKRKEAEAYKKRAKELSAEANGLNELLMQYRDVAAKAERLYHLGPEELVYDEKKGFVPRAGAKSRAR